MLRAGDGVGEPFHIHRVACKLHINRNNNSDSTNTHQHRRTHTGWLAHRHTNQLKRRYEILMKAKNSAILYGVGAPLAVSLDSGANCMCGAWACLCERTLCVCVQFDYNKCVLVCVLWWWSARFWVFFFLYVLL